MDLNFLRRMARDRVRVDLVAKNVGIYRAELNAEIRFSMAGVKECINQPFNPYQDKILLLIQGLEDSLKGATYVGFTSNQNHRKQHVIGYHFFETQIGGKIAYFNIQMTVQNQFFLYSITESIRWETLE
ncbi:hypothetical protein LXM25_07540 [Dyadobacter sp. LJ53]|uniref:LPD3 domain-containing protein n=1 Tax=Dyadobacter chenwenxiniae TaxID=2906456 RepID=UPI001F3E60AD|nr:hypothetical protein [Dyadobacter chenwenxiniae]MCF0049823.1 hypothetical protein [Dyadobacter chenwenxiniae]MCF0049901.1 hypothetical protein [Dyadobacter chenwenxiniae]